MVSLHINVMLLLIMFTQNGDKNLSLKQRLSRHYYKSIEIRVTYDTKIAYALEPFRFVTCFL